MRVSRCGNRQVTYTYTYIYINVCKLLCMPSMRQSISANVRVQGSQTVTMLAFLCNCQLWLTLSSNTHTHIYINIYIYTYIHRYMFILSYFGHFVQENNRFFAIWMSFYNMPKPSIYSYIYTVSRLTLHYSEIYFHLRSTQKTLPAFVRCGKMNKIAANLIMLPTFVRCA